MTTPTTPLDLDAAIEAGARAIYEMTYPGSDWERQTEPMQRGFRAAARASLTAIGYPALVEEVKRLRVDLETKSVVHECCVEIEQLRAERDAAIARAEVAEAKVAAGLDAIDGNPYYFPGWDQQFVDSERVRAALTEVQAGAGVGGTDPDECASCGEGIPRHECPKSKRPCGHHCNHSWTHDACDWCGTELGECDEPADPERRDDNGFLIGEDGFVDGPGGQRLKPYVRPQSVNPTESQVQA